jgi:hypothetical protein
MGNAVYQDRHRNAVLEEKQLIDPGRNTQNKI